MLGLRADFQPGVPIGEQVEWIVRGSMSGRPLWDAFPTYVTWLNELARDGGVNHAVEDFAHRVSVYATRPEALEPGYEGERPVPVPPGVEAVTADVLARSIARARTFLRTLDERAIALVTDDATGPLTNGHPDIWGAIDPTCGTGAPLARAISSYPYIQRALTNAWIADPTGFVARVDADMPGLAAHAAMAEVPGWTLRGVRLMGEAWMERLSVDDRRLETSATHSETDPTLQAVKLISGLPRNWMPTDGATATAAWTAMPAVRWACAMSANGTEAATLLDARGRWPEYVDRLGSACGRVSPIDAIDGLDDMATAFADQVARPATALVDGDDKVAANAWIPVDNSPGALLWSGLTLPRILSLSATWHADLHRIDAVRQRHGGAALDASWAPGLPYHREGDLEAVVLADTGALVDEGREGRDADGMEGLAHCVGGYSRRCATGASRIVSIRRIHPDGSRVRLSTAEFTHDPACGFTLHQHLGHANASPGPEAGRLVEGYVRLLGTGRLQADASVMRAVDPETFEEQEFGAFGYDHRAPGAWEDVRDAWAPFMPRTARGMSPQDLVATLRGQATPLPDRVGWLPARYQAVAAAPDEPMQGYLAGSP